MSKYIKFGFYAFILTALVYACSTEKNTAINRSFHYVNARFNGHFNANELLNVSLATYRDNLTENYYTLLPLEAIPSETDVKSLYAPIDTALSKVKIVIADHSMPTIDKPSKKNAENNNYIDENWITAGKAYYYRRDYETAMKSFKFINKYFSNNPSNYVGELWMAKTNIRIGQYADAKLSLDKLDDALKNDKSSSGSKTEKVSKNQSKLNKLNKVGTSSSSKKEDQPAKFPKKIKFELERTKADLALAHKDYAKATEYLENALKEAKKSEDKGRVNFILGQLYEQENNIGNAVARYRKARKYKIPYQMSFNAELKASILEGGPKVKKGLNKMLRDAKNAEFRDQIYYALAMIELRENNEDKAMEHLTHSAFYSTQNKRQKGMAYEKMGDLRYAKKDYIKAQKYYDSCGTVVDDTYPKVKDIRTKAAKLADLVVAVETAAHEDSLQRIAKMDPSEQEDFLKKVIKKQEEEAKLKTQREAEKLRDLAKNNNAFQQDMGKGGGYWSNSSLIAQGATEFQKVWGQRTNEDNWRRSEKTTVNLNPIENGEEGGEGDVAAEEASKPKGPTVESLMEGLPKTEEDFTKSNEKLVKALYDAGIIYKEMLKEPELAKTQFFGVLDRRFESEYNVMSSFQLYKMFETSDENQAITQRNYILNNYPETDYANYLRDPNYFVKKKERDALAEQEYVAVLQRYNRKVYFPVISKAQDVMDNEPDNTFRAKYMLLLAMSKGQTTEDKQSLLPILERVITEYPNSDESKRAQEMIDIIKNGYSKFEPAVFGNKTIYTYEEKSNQLVLVFLGEKDNIDVSKTRISDFTREFFPKSKAKVTSNLFGNSQNLIMVAEFPTLNDAKDYVRKYKATKKHLLNLQDAKILIITPKNLKTLFESKELQQYELFYTEYY